MSTLLSGGIGRALVALRRLMLGGRIAERVDQQRRAEGFGQGEPLAATAFGLALLAFARAPQAPPLAPVPASPARGSRGRRALNRL